MVPPLFLFSTSEQAGRVDQWFSVPALKNDATHSVLVILSGPYLSLFITFFKCHHLFKTIQYIYKIGNE